MELDNITEQEGFNDIFGSDNFPLNPTMYIAQALDENGKYSQTKLEELARHHNNLAISSWRNIKKYYCHFDSLQLLSGMQALFCFNYFGIVEELRNLSTYAHDIELSQCFYELYLDCNSKNYKPSFNDIFEFNFYIRLLNRNLHVQEYYKLLCSDDNIDKSEPELLLISQIYKIRRRSSNFTTSKSFVRNRAGEFCSVLNLKDHIGIYTDELLSFLINIDGTIENRFREWYNSEKCQSMDDISVGMLPTIKFSIDSLVKLFPKPVLPDRVSKIIDLLAHDRSDFSFDSLGSLMLNREISKKPFYKINKDEYLCVSPNSFAYSPITLIHSLAEQLNLLNDSFYMKRARAVENRISSLISNNLLSAKVMENVKWTIPDNDSQYETDLIVVVDGRLFVIEVKSGALSQRSLSGDSLRIKSDLRKLVHNSAFQAIRLVDNLPQVRFTNIENKSLARAVKETKKEDITVLSITHDNLGVLGSLPSKNNGRIRPISVEELEVVFKLFKLEVERIHYLVWRTQFNNLPLTDEIETLNYYFFVVFTDSNSYEEFIKLPDVEKSNLLQRTPWLREYEEKRITKSADDFEGRQFTSRWRNILTTLEKKRIASKSAKDKAEWLNICFDILEIDYGQQLEFEQHLDKHRNEILKQLSDMKEPTRFSAIINDQGRGKVALCPGISINSNSEGRNHAMTYSINKLLDETDVDRVYVFCIQDEYNDKDFTSFAYSKRKI